MESEVGGQIDDDPTRGKQLGHQVLGLAMGKGQEDQSRPSSSEASVGTNDRVG